MYLNDFCTVPMSLAGHPGDLDPVRAAQRRRCRSGCSWPGRPFSENRLLDAAYALEQALGFDGSGGRVSERRSEPVIGLEIHVQLATRDEDVLRLRRCRFGDPPNTHTCPVCLGLPGQPAGRQRAGGPLRADDRPRARLASSRRARSSTARTTSIPTCQGLPDLPVRRAAVPRRAARRACASTACTSRRTRRSSRTSARAGASTARTRASSTSTAAARRWSRSSPSPTCARAEQAGEWLRLLRTTLRALGVSDVNMEEGSLRCDANISLRPAGTEELGIKTELKNMNSFRFIERGIRAEIARQAKIIEGGGRGRAGDAALRPGLRRDHLAALQGGGARLPLLPRARPRAGRDRRGRCSRPRGPTMTELPADARRALRARARPQRRAARGCSRSAASSATSSRRRSPPARTRRPSRSSSPTGSAASCSAGSATSRTPPSRRSTPGGARRARRDGRAPSRSRVGAARKVLDRLHRRRRRPGRDRRGRGAGARWTAATSSPRSSRRRSRPTPTRRSACAKATRRRSARSSAR